MADTVEMQLPKDAAVRAAGVVGKTAHGLRKSRGAIMRENGAGMDQRMAWLGHDSALEAERYGRSADVRKIISGEAPQDTIRTMKEGSK